MSKKDDQRVIKVDPEADTILPEWDQQVGGNHYRKSSGEQLWDRLVRIYGLPQCRVFFIGNIISYLERYQDKDKLKDMGKAMHYLNKLIDLEKKEQGNFDRVIEDQE